MTRYLSITNLSFIDLCEFLLNHTRHDRKAITKFLESLTDEQVQMVLELLEDAWEGGWESHECL